MSCDLHIHSTCSDGTQTPEQIVAEALGKHLTAIAIADHDTVQGVMPAIEAARGSDLIVIPACEISTEYDGAEVHIRVPYWNSRWAWMDPQHVRTFHECTFDFFDPSKKYCKQRPYYSPARFKIEYVLFEGTWFFLGHWWYWKVPENRPRRVLHAITKLCDIVHFLQFHLRAIKNGADTPAP